MGFYRLINIYCLTVILITVTNIKASHFRGGTISWKSLGGKTVEFTFKMGWTFGDGPGCTEQKIGQFVNDPLLKGRGDPFDWICVDGCVGKPILQSPSYYCMAANKDEGWEQGQNTFTYTFKNDGPFRVAFDGTDWMALGNGKGSGPWSISTTVDLRTRSDTNKTNTSPEALSQAMYYVQYNCQHVMRIPVVDADGDKVLCKWAVGDECKTVCNGLPGARLNEESCTITFNSTAAQSYEMDKFYAVALTIRDYPRSGITLDGTDVKTPSDSLSSVPMQFLIKTTTFPIACNEKPQFVDPTPPEGEELLYQAGDLVEVTVAADNSRDVSKKVTLIDVIGPVRLQQSKLTQDTSRQNTFQKTLTWLTSNVDLGDHIICAKAQNERGKTGDPRCFTIEIVPDPCDSEPCLMGGTCHSRLGNFTCECIPGFTGRVCEININDCEPKPCQNGGICHDLINDYVCTCEPGFTDKNCSTDIDDCLSDPCMHAGNCTDQVNDFTCLCTPGYTGKNCHIGVDFCLTKPCLNGGICENGFSGFTCHCTDGWAGRICDYRTAVSKRSTCSKKKQGSATSKMLRTRQKSCCQETEYSDCQCYLSPHAPPHVIGMDPATRDLLCALIGFPIGLGLSFITFNLLRRCTAGVGTKETVQRYRAKHPPTKLFTNRTQIWINDQSGDESHSRRISTASSRYRNNSEGTNREDLGSTPPPSYSSLSLAPMNIYRASFNDESMHKTATKKNTDTYIGGAADWGNGKIQNGKRPSICGKVSGHQSGLQGSNRSASPPPSFGESVKTTNIYRASFNDEGMHRTATKKNADTYSGGAADWGNGKTQYGKGQATSGRTSCQQSDIHGNIDSELPSPSIGESVKATNIYRPSFNDENLHRIAEKRNPDTYNDGSADWDNTLTSDGQNNKSSSIKPSSDTPSDQANITSTSHSAGEPVVLTNIYRDTYNDERIDKTAAKKNTETYSDAASDWRGVKISDVSEPVIYRASFNDDGVHKIAAGDNPDTYSDGSADWGSSKILEDNGTSPISVTRHNTKPSRPGNSSVDLLNDVSDGPPNLLASDPPKVQRGWFNDESMHETGGRQNLDTYTDGVADCSNC